MKIGNNSYQARNYETNSSNKFISINTGAKNIRELTDYLSTVAIKKSIAGIIIFSDEVDNNAAFTLNNISAFAIYEDNGKTYNTRIFKKAGSNFEESKLSNLETNFISSNDFLNISLSLHNKIYRKTIAVIDFKNLETKGKKQLALQSTLKSYQSLFAKNGGHLCTFPCQPDMENAWCLARESQLGGEDWYCMEDPCVCANDCLEEQEETLQPTNPSVSTERYRNENTRAFLHDFRDNYLGIENEGQKYIDMYYELSASIKLSEVDITFIEDTFGIINDLRPKLENLLNNRNSTSTILIDSETSSTLTNYLTTYSYIFGGVNSQNQINFLINKINEFEDQNNLYITENL